MKMLVFIVNQIYHLYIILIYICITKMFQLEDQYTLFDYGININDVIQLTSRTPENSSQNNILSKIDDDVKNNTSVVNDSVVPISNTVEVHFFIIIIKNQ